MTREEREERHVLLFAVCVARDLPFIIPSTPEAEWFGIVRDDHVACMESAAYAFSRGPSARAVRG